ncbi:L,D-transpeptidase [Catenuloplanes indicus]|uniref:Lipoprotein-anchoring transpeptidase ErfK/SrfK n=1 Tax=Catenuloplanes indicus TaxID=137267 RepID=A0AAE3VYF7_9ACTN|nr:Ig-like domain-containing protein [Catenuloplanes indicus]MDQ0366538.1 lipoprotein-anchoring transpeptidase ErfK/SrfK [Catenuloplanes indicus]
MHATRSERAPWGVPGSRIRRRAFGALVLAGVIGFGSACSGGDSSPTWQSNDAGASAGPAATTESPAPIGATLKSPAEGSKNAPITTDISFDLVNAVSGAVVVKNAKGEPVPGKLSEDGKTWAPDKKLSYGTTYTIEYTGTDASGRTGSTTGTFTTMGEPKNTVRTVSFMGEGATVGVGMPLMLSFSREIPEEYRAEVEKHLTVVSDPPQEGTWGWLSADSIQFRPAEYWKAGTKITYGVDHAGVEMGKGWYGKTDYEVNVTIGSQFIMEVDNKTKHMTVIKDGKKVKDIPVSLGQPKFPSVSGTMLIMEKLRKTTFDTYGQFSDEDAYRVDVEYAQRVTWGGQFIHAAPWSNASQGRENVSHGCVNVSQEAGKWLFEQTKLGDPLIVKNTGVPLVNGDGWTVWNMSYDDFKGLSAL